MNIYFPKHQRLILAESLKLDFCIDNVGLVSTHFKSYLLYQLSFKDLKVFNLTISI